MPRVRDAKCIWCERDLPARTARSVTITVDVENRTGPVPDTVISVRAQRGHDSEPMLIANQDEVIGDDALRGAMATLLRSALKLVEGNDQEWVDGGKYGKMPPLEPIKPVAACPRCGGRVYSIAGALAHALTCKDAVT